MIPTGKGQLRNENEMQKLGNTAQVFGFYFLSAPISLLCKVCIT